MSQETRLLRQPTISEQHIAFCYGGDIWISGLNDSSAIRLTSTPAVESDPHFSPDGKWIAFTSNRSGNSAVYIVPSEGGDASRLTWHPSRTNARGWTPDGKRVLFASARNTPPSSFDRLWTVPMEGGPAEMLSSQWASDGSFSPDGNRIIIDRIKRWDVEWRAYRGGQNTPLIILDLNDKSEILLPNESTTDIKPVWMGDKIYFLSDRDYISNIWSYSISSGELNKLTNFTETDVKCLSSNGKILAFEQEGYLHIMDPVSGEHKRLRISVIGDFPWAETGWEDLSPNTNSVSLSPTGKRLIMEARGEIFTTPVKYGDSRNITRSSGAADRSPVWSPKGDNIAWFSDIGGKGYSLLIASQDGLSEARSISIGESKMAWEPAWSGDGKYIAFTDDDVRVRIVDIESEEIYTVDTGGTNLERGSMGLAWSHDSKWLAYSRGGTNNFRRIMIWSVTEKSLKPVTNEFADSYSPAWDMDNAHLYFLASTDLALGSGWANTSSMTSDPVYLPYIINLKKDDPSPFELRSDEESIEKENDSEKERKNKKAKEKEESSGSKDQDTEKKEELLIDFENIERRTIPLPVPRRNYSLIQNGPAGTVFLGEQRENVSGVVLHKFTLKEREAKEFISGARQVSVSADGNKILAMVNGNWQLMTTSNPNGNDGETVSVKLKVKINRAEEWKQIFEEAWRYEQDYFYDRNMHGRDWNEVYKRYAPLVPYIKHRTDLTYILDQMNGELSVGHSFVGGGDYPDVESSSSGLLGADLVAENNYWKISRIYTTESWNPGLSSPLDRPGIKVEEGNYLVGINGKEITDAHNIFRYLDGTVGRQTIIHINKEPKFEGSWKETIEPISSENALRQRAWVEDNRRLVDKLSNGRLAYIWVPNTGGPGFVSFNRYFFAQQDKEGAIIDERFNGGGLLDDYMVDLMTRKLRASLTNEVPDGKPMQLPAGILGPKVLLINELAGSGGDFFPWVFRQQKVGPLIGMTTWGGLVKSSVHYSMVDGGYLTAPDNAVFDPVNNEWVAENKGVPPDIEVRQDAVALDEGHDPQLERAVEEALLLIEKEKVRKITPPPFPTPAKKKH
ncbi:MAG: PD40 domain-containing protein [Bacteroidales bacterium]|nr:PD40 domain-containing protein [Bacteroidales bacterium]